MTSAADAKGEITYYEYDGFQRLINVRNKDGNIIKHDRLPTTRDSNGCEDE